MTYADIESKSFGPGEEGDDGSPSGMARAWYAHMSGLKATYHRLVNTDPLLRDQRIDLLLDPNQSAHDKNDTNWGIPNEIEILLVRLLPSAEVGTELASAFATAERVAVPSRSQLAKLTEAAQTDDDRKAVLATLLRDTHNRFAGRRSERVARRIVALRMTRLGYGLTAFVALVLLVLGSGIGGLDYAQLAKYNLCVATFFGFLGAYLSRLIAFQTGAPSLSFDDLENGYSMHFLLVRLLVGGLSALVIYFVIAGQLVGGDLFPGPAEGETGGFGALWKVYDVKTAKNLGGLGYTGPTASFAKLIVWCFIAGFSERFLPDHLTSLEAKSKA